MMVMMVDHDQRGGGYSDHGVGPDQSDVRPSTRVTFRCPTALYDTLLKNAPNRSRVVIDALRQVNPASDSRTSCRTGRDLQARIDELVGENTRLAGYLDFLFHFMQKNASKITDMTGDDKRTIETMLNWLKTHKHVKTP